MNIQSSKKHVDHRNHESFIHHNYTKKVESSIKQNLDDKGGGWAINLTTTRRGEGKTWHIIDPTRSYSTQLDPNRSNSIKLDPTRFNAIQRDPMRSNAIQIFAHISVKSYNISYRFQLISHSKYIFNYKCYQLV